MAKTATKKVKTTETKSDWTHRVMTDLKAGHEAVPADKGWSDAFHTCRICGRAIVLKFPES